MSAEPVRIAMVGLGKIARDQHLPAIAGNDRFRLVATVDPIASGVPGVPHFGSLARLLADGPSLDAAVFCTPPQIRHELAAVALARGLHIFLEKPPGATIGEVEVLRDAAAKSGATLLAAWHSRFAPYVETARVWLVTRRIERVSVIWREDVRLWHPGQDWIWKAGGLGVFDPGINALSILTHMLPHQFYMTHARLTFPENWAAPIAAELVFRDTAGTEITMDLDFRQTGPQSWDIVVDTDAGTLKLASGGAMLSLPSGGSSRLEEREYSSLYDYFADLIATGASDVDIRPLQLVADAFLSGHREVVEAFYE